MAARQRQNQLVLERTTEESVDEDDDKDINVRSKVIKDFDEGASPRIRKTRLLDDAVIIG